jgi:hypothetical protein
VVSTSKSYAQIEFGLKSGISFSTYSWQDKVSYIKQDEFEYSYGPNLGAFVEYSFFNSLSLISEFYYVQKGIKIKLLGTIRADNAQGYITKIISYQNNLDYLGLSFGSKFKYRTGNFIPYILMGVRFEFIISKDIDQLYRNAYSEYDKNIFGLTFGLGSEFQDFLFFPIIVETVYNYDFTKIEIARDIFVRPFSFELKLGVKI